MSRRIAGGVGELFGAKEFASGGIGIVVGEGVGDEFTDLGPQNVVDKKMGVFGVIGGFWNGQIVHEEMGSRLR